MDSDLWVVKLYMIFFPFPCIFQIYYHEHILFLQLITTKTFFLMALDFHLAWYISDFPELALF